MNVRLVERLPAGGEGRYASYDHPREKTQGWQHVEIRLIARRRQAQWLRDLDAWHREVSAAAGSAFGWWLSPGSRFAAWYPIDLKPLFFVLAALEAAESGPDPVYLVGCPPQVEAFIAEWGGAGTVRSTSRRAPLWGSLARAVLAQARRSLLRSRRPRGTSRVVVFSLALDTRILATEGDHYFGDMLDGLGTDVAWVYYPDKVGDLHELRAYLRGTGRRVHFYFDWLGPREVARTLVDATRTARALEALSGHIPPLRIAGRTSHAFAIDFHQRVVRNALPVNEIAAYHALRRALAELRPDTIVYPYEDKGFERALLLARDAVSPTTRAVAFAHAVYNEGHVYARDGRRGALPHAETIGITGEAARHWFVGTAGVPGHRVAVIGSPRYRPASPPQPPSSLRRERLRVLFVIGYGHEPGVLASYAESDPGMLDRCDLLIRRYPYSWAQQQDDGIARLRACVPALRVELASLDEQIRWCDVVLFDSTSAGVHAMLRGRLAVSVALPDLFSADLAQGKGDLTGLIRCDDAPSLAAALDRIRALDDEAYLELERLQQRAASAIYSAPDPSRLADLLLAGGVERSRPPLS